MDKKALKERIKAFSQGRVMVVGDVAIDEMIYGETSRLSREAPVIILHHSKTDILLGGGTNAAHNLAALGAKKVTMAGVAGTDYYATLLFEAMERDGVSKDGIVQDPARPTVTKSRISGSARQSVMQQIVRIDRESHEPLSKKIEEQLIDTIMTQAPNHDAMILSDYKLGVVTPKVIEVCQGLAKKRKMTLAVDSHQDLALFQGATIATPNLPEAEQNIGYDLTSSEKVVKGGRELMKRAGLENLLITRGSDGMSLFDEHGAVHHIPVFNKSEVFDVTGAGDTVIATLTLSMATGATPLEAAVLGNIAASIVVKKYATAVTSTEEMLNTLEELDASLLKFESHKASV